MNDTKTLPTMIDDIINLAGTTGVTIPVIRGHLMKLRKTAKALEARVSAIESNPKDSILSNENDRLLLRLEESHQQIELLEYDIAKTKEKAKRRHPDEDRLLLLIAKNGSQSESSIVEHLGIYEQVALSHIRNLANGGLIGMHEPRRGESGKWSIEPRGTDYLRCIRKIK